VTGKPQMHEERKTQVGGRMAVFREGREGKRKGGRKGERERGRETLGAAAGA
jgi:hypothetical protein